MWFPALLLSTVCPCQSPLCAAPTLHGLFPLVLGLKGIIKIYRWKWKSTDWKRSFRFHVWENSLSSALDTNLQVDCLVRFFPPVIEIKCFPNYTVENFEDFAQRYKILLKYWWLCLNYQIPVFKIFISKWHYFYLQNSCELTSNPL